MRNMTGIRVGAAKMSSADFGAELEVGRGMLLHGLVAIGNQPVRHPLPTLQTFIGRSYKP